MDLLLLFISTFIFLPVARPFTKEEVKEMEMHDYGFDTLDVDEDGKLNRTEVEMLMVNIAAERGIDLDDLMDKFDMNDNGFIDRAEFLLLAKIGMSDSESDEDDPELDKLIEKAATEFSFKKSDKDFNGFITVEEMENDYDDFKKEVFLQFDGDGDGRLNLQEYIKYANRKQGNDHTEL